MSQHIWVNFDENIDLENRFWITNRFIFNIIFNRTKALFRPAELVCQEACYQDWGIEGLELSYVDKDCFNIFCARCEEAFNKYPDEKAMEYENSSEDRRGTYEHVAWEWTEILNRLKLDVRYDPLWMAEYVIKNP